MRIKALIVLILALGNVAADASAALSAVVCPAPAGDRGKGAMTCCCGPAACPDTQVPGSGLAPRCCSMRENGRTAETTPPPASPESGAAAQAIAVAGTPAATVVDLTGSGLPALADAAIRDHRAPPLYDLFRAYRN